MVMTRDHSPIAVPHDVGGHRVVGRERLAVVVGERRQHRVVALDVSQLVQALCVGDVPALDAVLHLGQDRHRLAVRKRVMLVQRRVAKLIVICVSITMSATPTMEIATISSTNVVPRSMRTDSPLTRISGISEAYRDHPGRTERLIR